MNTAAKVFLFMMGTVFLCFSRSDLDFTAFRRALGRICMTGSPEALTQFFHFAETRGGSANWKRSEHFPLPTRFSDVLHPPGATYTPFSRPYTFHKEYNRTARRSA